MSWCTLDWVTFEGLSDREDGPRRKAFQAKGTENVKAWDRADPGASRDPRGRWGCLRDRKEAGYAGLWGPFKI